MIVNGRILEASSSRQARGKKGVIHCETPAFLPSRFKKNSSNGSGENYSVELSSSDDEKKNRKGKGVRGTGGKIRSSKVRLGSNMGSAASSSTDAAALLWVGLQFHTHVL
jgi:hypothetical protein